MDNLRNSPPSVPRPVMTVLGPVPYTDLGTTDAHNHVWIGPIPGSDSSSPILNLYEAIRQELTEYRTAGGVSILDCQPGGCGRDGNRLRLLSQETGVHLVACTGFHRRKYYTSDYWLWTASSDMAGEYFTDELNQSLMETREEEIPVLAGFIKIALEENWKDTPQAALEGAAQAAVTTGSLLEIHTEKGRLAEKACVYFTDLGVFPHQLVLCHMDKRPDPCLHTELAHFGVLLEYDTFFRPKYNPARNLWPLISELVKAGCADRIAFATDMAEASMYRTISGGPGLLSLPRAIRGQLHDFGYSDQTIQQMLGGNIARRLAGLI